MKMKITISVLIFLIIINKINTLNSQTNCVFEYNSTLIAQGEVYSPNYPKPYPNNLNCRYEFYARDNERVIIRIEDFQLEQAQNTALNDINFMDFLETVTRPNPGGTKPPRANALSHESEPEFSPHSNRQCFYDFLDVFTSDGQGRLYWRSRHCGNQIDEQIVSTSPTLILVFHTDRMLGYRGFKFHFHFSYLNILPFVTDPICGPSEIAGNGSVLSSPNYPLTFPSNTECAWTITVEKTQNVLIKFIDVNLNQDCSHSQIAIWDGYVSDITKPDFVVCEKLTYYHKGIKQYKSKSNRLVIRFLGNKQTENLVENLDEYKLENFLSPKKKILNASRSKNSKIKNGFFLSWNGIRLDDDCGQDFQCKGGEYCIDSKNFLCQQTYKYCISKSLLCDGVYNCDTGDESDERHCELTFLQSKIYLVLIIVASVIFVLLTVLFGVVHWANKTNKTSSRIIKKKPVESEFFECKPSSPAESNTNNKNFDVEFKEINKNEQLNLLNQSMQTELTESIENEKILRRNSYTKAIFLENS